VIRVPGAISLRLNYVDSGTGRLLELSRQITPPRVALIIYQHGGLVMTIRDFYPRRKINSIYLTAGR
tara:strand:+ start:3447 stop:3647 length:201 start_codon:yes stop_codon:yes gene_type:complete